MTNLRDAAEKPVKYLVADGGPLLSVPFLEGLERMAVTRDSEGKFTASVNGIVEGGHLVGWYHRREQMAHWRGIDGDEGDPRA